MASIEHIEFSSHDYYFVVIISTHGVYLDSSEKIQIDQFDEVGDLNYFMIESAPYGECNMIDDENETNDITDGLINQIEVDFKKYGMKSKKVSYLKKSGVPKNIKESLHKYIINYNRKLRENKEINDYRQASNNHDKRYFETHDAKGRLIKIDKTDVPNKKFVRSNREAYKASTSDDYQVKLLCIDKRDGITEIVSDISERFFIGEQYNEPNYNLGVELKDILDAFLFGFSFDSIDEDNKKLKVKIHPTGELYIVDLTCSTIQNDSAITSRERRRRRRHHIIEHPTYKSPNRKSGKRKRGNGNNTTKKKRKNSSSPSQSPSRKKLSLPPPPKRKSPSPSGKKSSSPPRRKLF